MSIIFFSSLSLSFTIYIYILYLYPSIIPWHFFNALLSHAKPFETDHFSGAFFRSQEGVPVETETEPVAPTLLGVSRTPTSPPARSPRWSRFHRPHLQIKPLWMMRHFRCPSKRLDPTDPTETTDPTDRPQIARAKIESLSLPMRRQLTSSHQKRIKVQSVHPGQPQLPRKPNCQALEWRKWRKISMIHPHPDLPHSEGLRWHAQPQMRKTQKTRKTRKNSRFQCALWVRSVV